MRARDLSISAIKILILLGVAGGLYAFNRSREKDLPIIDDDDVNVTAQVTVQTGKVERRMLRQYEDVYGIVEAEPARDGRSAAGGTILMPVTTQVTWVDCLEGGHVRAGEPVLKLDARAAQAELDRATASFDAAVKANDAAKSDTTIFQRDKLRFERDAADAAAQLAVAHVAMDRLVITSPVSGTVLRLNVRSGEVVSAGTVVMEIADENRLIIACTAPPAAQAGIVVGAPAEAVLDNAEGVEQVIPAKVNFIDPGIDPVSGSASIDVVLDAQAATQPATRLRAGQTVHVRLITNQHEGLAVPEESVVEDAQGHATVSLVERDFRWAVRRTVETGLRDQGWVEVKSPDLSAGRDVVTVGAYALTDKCRIEVTR